jgi:MurNAc alpha-1-phosphate uridylyltransferase
MKAMILAAGMGKRMRPLTDHCPKPLLMVNDTPLIVHHIKKLVAIGITDITINHAYLGHMIEEYLQSGEKWGANITYSPESPSLETGGGIYNALPILTNEFSHNNPFLLINGDIWIEEDFSNLQSYYQHLITNKKLAHLWLTKNPLHNTAGDFSLSNEGTILFPDTLLKTHTYSGVSLLSPLLFKNCQHGFFPLKPLFEQAISDDLLSGHLSSHYWVDVGTPERLTQLDQKIRQLNK